MDDRKALTGILFALKSGIPWEMLPPPIWDAIDAANRMRDKLLLILSKSAIVSDWVEDRGRQGVRRGAPP